MFPFAPPIWKPPATGTNNATVTAWRAQVITDGGTVSAGRRTAMDTLFNSGVTNGWLAKLDYMAILAAENTQSALRDIINIRALTPVGAPTFTTDRGYTFSGSNYINSGYNPATMGVQGTQNAFSIGVWNRTTASLQRIQFGSEFSTNGTGLIIPQAGNGGFYQVNAPGVGNLSAVASNGFWLAIRTGSTAAACYKNGSSVSTDTTTVSNAIQSSNFGIGADLTGGGPSSPCTDQLAIACVGGDMTSVQSAFYTDLNTFATAVGF